MNFNPPSRRHAPGTKPAIEPMCHSLSGNVFARRACSTGVWSQEQRDRAAT